MAKPVQRNRSKNKVVKTCENCINCMYVEKLDYVVIFLIMVLHMKEKILI